MENKLDLYNAAKEAYYNGEPIMTDLEFDELEKELGLENKSYIGTRHNPSYTIQHPFVMGSLAKVQIKEVDGNVDWEGYLGDVSKFINRFTNKCSLLVTPKYDGCAFEARITKNKVVSISTRGDGQYGKDIYKHIIGKLNSTHTNIAYSDYTLRGEVLIDKNVFEAKYSNFVNPRSFVAGILNRDYDESIQDMLNDLSLIIYDVRSFDNGTWFDHDWTTYIEMENTPEFYMDLSSLTLNAESFKDIYNKFDEYRQNCPFALDGIVFKPTSSFRNMDNESHRPKDCVAVKFMPMLEETVVTSITWNLGKTGELIPIINVNPIKMDGKMISKCSGHNYGYLEDNKIGVGTKVILSLAGDIIPFLYKVTNTDNFSEVGVPENYESYVDGCHLMAILSEEERAKRKFINSITALNIPTIGGANAKEIFEYISKNNGETDDFFGESTSKVVDNILYLSPEEVYFGVGGGKTGTNAQKAYKKVLEQLTLVDVLKTCNFKLCGSKASKQIENYLTGQTYDFEHIPGVAYDWVFDRNSNNYQYIESILTHLGKTFDDFKEIAIENNSADEDKIPVILTGEPNNYSSKSEFLQYNPQYRMTGSWKEVKIVFTNSMDSKTGKMKKAIEKGIEIRLY